MTRLERLSKSNYTKLKYIFSLTLAALVFLISSSFSSAEDNPDAIVGVWKTGSGNAHVKIYKNGDKYQGKIVWLKDPIDPETGKPKLDTKHPDNATRARQIMGIINIWGFKYVESNKWDGGNIYDPKNGNTYSSNIKMENSNTLKVRGYVGISLIGRTDTWTRQTEK